MATFKTIRSARPNGYPIELNDCGGGWYCVVEADDDGFMEDEGSEFDNLPEAERFFNERVRELRGTPNWELQAEYDERHGTINGYSPWQYEREY